MYESPIRRFSIFHGSFPGTYLTNHLNYQPSQGPNFSPHRPPGSTCRDRMANEPTSQTSEVRPPQKGVINHQFPLSKALFKPCF